MLEPLTFSERRMALVAGLMLMAGAAIGNVWAYGEGRAAGFKAGQLEAEPCAAGAEP